MRRRVENGVGAEKEVWEGVRKKKRGHNEHVEVGGGRRERTERKRKERERPYSQSFNSKPGSYLAVAR